MGDGIAPKTQKEQLAHLYQNYTELNTKVDTGLTQLRSEIQSNTDQLRSEFAKVSLDLKQFMVECFQKPLAQIDLTSPSKAPGVLGAVTTPTGTQFFGDSSKSNELVKSKSVIPNVVMGNANGDTFRIMVSILEDDHNIFLPSRDHGGCNSDYGDSSQSSMEASSSSTQHDDRMDILGSTEAFNDKSMEVVAESRDLCSQDIVRTRLLEDEMMGGTESCMSSKQLEGINVVNGHIVPYDIGSLEEVNSQSPLEDPRSSPLKAFCPLIGEKDNIEGWEAVKPNKTKRDKFIGNKKKKNRKGVTKLVFGENYVHEILPEASVLDQDIAHRYVCL
ncbi:hypothetical protein COLO4_10256 [Corchorus olitorius]|uniref:Uncharacterized protein n=1 Tax=Corchorus olitorius TaxID=93759 RepID=A0A1R3K9E0_9ROSI|nr:hypothetical protein COLO4_10256 [Corchorus olitorius]